MNIDEIAPQALRLPARERALLAASLWESVEDPYSLTADRSDEDALALAMARDAELESGAVAPILHSDLMSRLRGSESTIIQRLQTNWRRFATTTKCVPPVSGVILWMSLNGKF
jgi:hypothetical protein